MNKRFLYLRTYWFKYKKRRARGCCAAQQMMCACMCALGSTEGRCSDATSIAGKVEHILATDAFW